MHLYKIVVATIFIVVVSLFYYHMYTTTPERYTPSVLDTNEPSPLEMDEPPLPEKDESGTQLAELVRNDGILLKHFTSTKETLRDRQEDVRTRMEQFINGGQHNIVSVETAYRAGFLESGDVYYIDKNPREGNKLRIMFVHSDNHPIELKAQAVQAELDAVKESGKYDIVRITPKYLYGYMIAAEIIYREK